MIIKILSSFLAFLSGWTIPESHIQKLKSLKRSVIVYPHTSVWDFIISIILIKSQLSEKNVIIPMWHKNMGHPRSFRYKVLTSIGIIPVLDKSGGLNRIVKILNQHKEFLFLISPEGTTQKTKKFRKGFWHIANQTNSTLTVVNLDFKTHTIVKGPTWDITYINTDIKFIEKCFAVHTPCYPHLTYYATHHKSPFDVIEWDRILIILLILSFIKVCFEIKIMV